MRILTIVGARPQFIKAATISRAIRVHNAKCKQEEQRPHIEEIIVHTGQHFDANMSDVFFSQLDIPQPHHNLGIASLGHGAMTGRMLEAIESLLKEHRPDRVLVYGDTNSTLAGALAAAKLHIPVVHVEAGLRSHNPSMPEEINRVLTDRVSSLLLCPTETAIANLKQEGFPFPAPGGSTQRIENVGDVMYDAVLYYRDLAHRHINIDTWGLQHQGYALCTLHRQENTDDLGRLINILDALNMIAEELPVVLPLHPRTRQRIASADQQGKLDKLTISNPLPYLEMQRLQMSAKVILTDSGGMQKEAYFHQVPCITLRDETEWVESIEAGWNRLVGADCAAIVEAFSLAAHPTGLTQQLYGDGQGATRVVGLLGDIG